MGLMAHVVLYTKEISLTMDNTLVICLFKVLPKGKVKILTKTNILLFFFKRDSRLDGLEELKT